MLKDDISRLEKYGRKMEKLERTFREHEEQRRREREEDRLRFFEEFSRIKDDDRARDQQVQLDAMKAMQMQFVQQFKEASQDFKSEMKSTHYVKELDMTNINTKKLNMLSPYRNYVETLRPVRSPTIS